MNIEVERVCFLFLIAEIVALEQYHECMDAAVLLEETETISILKKLISDENKHASIFMSFLKRKGQTEEDIEKNITKYFPIFNEIKNIDHEFLTYKEILVKNNETNLVRSLESIFDDEKIHIGLVKNLIALVGKTTK